MPGSRNCASSVGGVPGAAAATEIASNGSICGTPRDPSPHITVMCGDGSLGVPQMEPFDAISVAAAAPGTPPTLLAQLRDPGILVIPAGTRKDQELQVV